MFFFKCVYLFQAFAAALARESGEDASKIKFGANVQSDGSIPMSIGKKCIIYFKLKIFLLYYSKYLIENMVFEISN